MAPPRGFPRRDFINSRNSKDIEFGYDPRRQAESNDRRARNLQNMAESGMSAPYSGSDQSPSAMEHQSTVGTIESPDERWRRIFPNRPQAYGGGAPPKISARDSAIAASGMVQPMNRGPMPTVQRDANGVATGHVPTIEENRAYINGTNATPAGPPRLDARSLAAMDHPEQFAPQATAASSIPSQMTPSAPIVQTPGLPPAVESSTGIVRDMGAAHRFAADSSERANLYATNPAIFESGTPENTAYVAHAKQYGEKSANDNIASILPRAANRVASNEPRRGISAYDQ